MIEVVITILSLTISPVQMKMKELFYQIKNEVEGRYMMQLYKKLLLLLIFNPWLIEKFFRPCRIYSYWFNWCEFLFSCPQLYDMPIITICSLPIKIWQLSSHVITLNDLKSKILQGLTWVLTNSLKHNKESRKVKK